MTLLRDLAAVYAATWREGVPMLAVGPLMFLYALILEAGR